MRYAKMLLIFCALMLFVSFTAMAADTKLTWYHCCGQKERVELFNAWAREFEAQNPGVKVDAIYPVTAAGEVYYDKIAVAIASDMAPDVIWAGHGVWGLADQLMPLDDLYKSNSMIREIVPNMLDNHRWQGNLIAIPFGVNTHAFFYNKDALAASGQVMPKDWSWDQAIPMTQRLTSDTNGDGVPDVWGMAFTETAHVLNYEGNVYTPDLRKVTIDNPVTIAGFQMTADIMTDRYSNCYNRAAGTAANAFNGFLSGTLAMMSRGVFDIPTVTKSASFDWDVAMFPKLVVNGRDYRSSYFSQETWAIYKGTKDPALAKKFLSFIMQKEHMGQFAKLGAVVPTQASVAVNYFLNMNKPANIKAFTDTLYWYKNSERNHPASLRIDSFTTFKDIMAGRIPASTGVPELARQMNAVLDDYWASRGK